MKEKTSVEIFDENYKYIKERIAQAAVSSGRKPEDITLLAATKTVDIDVINYAISKGLEYIGENRVQEFLSKYDSFAPVHKHFIGHLQTNKVKDIVGKVELIHSVDSLHLAREISKKSTALGITSDVLLEINIGGEESKSGFTYEEAVDAVYNVAMLNNIRIKGLMAIPPIDIDGSNTKYFQKMHNLFIDISGKNIDNSSMDILSMGMSDDYEDAILQGATLVRVGTALFGRRNYL